MKIIVYNYEECVHSPQVLHIGIQDIQVGMRDMHVDRLVIAYKSPLNIKYMINPSTLLLPNITLVAETATMSSN